jgi:SnoaL-like domain
MVMRVIFLNFYPKEIDTSAWSEPDTAKRMQLLEKSVHPDCLYTDPNIQTTNHAQLSAYMQEFLSNAPGCKFVTTKFESHHDRSLVHYDMVDRKGVVQLKGASYGMCRADGRLMQMVGFQ